MDGFFNSRSRLDRWAQVGIGHKDWPSAFAQWPSGFYIEGIGLEELGSAVAESPSVAIWLKPPKTTHVDFETLGESRATPWVWAVFGYARGGLSEDRLANARVLPNAQPWSFSKAIL